MKGTQPWLMHRRSPRLSPHGSLISTDPPRDTSTPSPPHTYTTTPFAENGNGRFPLRQYMPSKPAKYGIKIWAACDAQSSYAWKMQVCTGKPTTGGPEMNQGMQVMLDVTDGLRGHIVTCDNLSTSYELSQKFLKRKIMFAFTPTTTLVSYLPNRNKNVVLWSTLHKTTEISNRADREPAIILDYNHNKGDVYNLDKVIGTCSCRRMTAHWPLVILHNITDVSSYNTFVIWNKINPKWMPDKYNKRTVFLEQMGKALVTPHVQRRERLPHTAASAALVKALTSNVNEIRADGRENKEDRERLAEPERRLSRDVRGLGHHFPAVIPAFPLTRSPGSQPLMSVRGRVQARVHLPAFRAQPAARQ
eukprot:superscaffoldBa00001141_g9148